MSQFEYLSRVSFGQYLPLNSPIHRMNPGAKLFGFCLFILALSLSKSMAGLLAAVAIVLLLLALSKVSIRFALRGLRTPLPFILFLAVLQLFLASYQTDETPLFAWKFLKITPYGIHAALLICVRFIGFVLLFTLSSTTTSTLEVVHGIDMLGSPLRFLGIRTRSAAMVVQIMLRFIPSLALSAEKIAKSQASRGAVWGDSKAKFTQKIKQLMPLILPLFITNLHQADAMAAAMLARGYASQNKRTHMAVYAFGIQDGIFLLFMAASAGLILFW
jgi:energy-coupling factor transport system permease protein